MNGLTYFFILMLGSIVGSFLNVVLLRKNTGETIARGRSRCFSCGKMIVWYDNIPLFSYLFLRGRCRHCRSKISLQYPLVEFLVGLLALLVFSKFNFSDPARGEKALGEFIFYFGAFFALFAVAAYDARTKIIDRHLLNIFAGFSVISALLRWSRDAFAVEIVLADLGISGAIWLFFWAMCYFSDETWMGGGDSGVAWWCALFLGYPLAAGMLLLSFWIGGAFGIAVLVAHQIKILRKRRAKSSALKMQIPFAPFLALGTLSAWYFAGIVHVFFQALF